MQTFYKIVQIFVLFFLLFRSHQSMCVAFRTVSLYIVVLRSFHIQMLMNLNNTSLKLQVWLTFFFFSYVQPGSMSVLKVCFFHLFFFSCPISIEKSTNGQENHIYLFQLTAIIYKSFCLYIQLLHIFP